MINSEFKTVMVNFYNVGICYYFFIFFEKHKQ